MFAMSAKYPAKFFIHARQGLFQALNGTICGLSRLIT